jgi:hypothetical protein
MQRRAAAIYVAFFVVIGAASYSVIATADSPSIQFENPDYSLSQGDTFEAQGQTYNVSSISATEESGGHGGGASLVRSGELTYTEQSVEFTETWENDSVVAVDDANWTVVVPNESDPAQFTLQENISETTLLEQDPQADNETVTREGQEFVVVQNGEGNATLVPADEYFPDPQTQQYSEGDTFQYDGNETTIANVTQESVEVSWTGPQTSTVEVSDEGNVTLGDQTYLAYFPDNSTMQLTQNFESYERQTEEIDTFHTRENGLWGVSIVSFTVAVLLIGLAYLPSRY